MVVRNTSNIGPHDTENLLCKFWEIETVRESTYLTGEKKLCEQHINSTTKRNFEGRSIIKLPIKEGPICLGRSKTNAMKKFLSNELTLYKNTEMCKKKFSLYSIFLSLGHLEKVRPYEVDTHPHYYLPHHCYAKDDSTATKLRLVFDASAITTSSLPLNDCLTVGPKLEDDIF